MMLLRMVGCSHHHTSLEIREKLAFDVPQIIDFLSKLQRDYDCEGVLVSTCNRVEMYVASHSESGLPNHSELVQRIANYHQIDHDEVVQELKTFENESVIEHLFSVAASLDSLVVGETQIIGQVKEAYELSRNEQFAGPVLHAAFQQASYAARRVANETEIQKRRLSVPSIAVSEIASDFFEQLHDKSIAVIGTGDMGQETMRYLAEAGTRNITVVNRSIENAQNLAAQFDAQIAEWSKLDETLVNSDLIVSTTGATEPIMTADRMQNIVNQRSRGTMLILDLAVPRDFEAAIGELPGVYLYSLDDLQNICDRNAALRKKEWPAAQKIIRDEVARFFDNADHQNMGPMIQQLRAQAQQIKESELGRLKNKLIKHGVNGPVEKEIEQSFERLVNKLLHPPLKSLREESEIEQRASLVAALKRLFQLKD